MKKIFTLIFIFCFSFFFTKNSFALTESIITFTKGPSQTITYTDQTYRSPATTNNTDQPIIYSFTPITSNLTAKDLTFSTTGSVAFISNGDFRLKSIGKVEIKACVESSQNFTDACATQILTIMPGVKYVNSGDRDYELFYTENIYKINGIVISAELGATLQKNDYLDENLQKTSQELAKFHIPDIEQAINTISERGEKPHHVGRNNSDPCTLNGNFFDCPEYNFYKIDTTTTTTINFIIEPYVYSPQQNEPDNPSQNPEEKNNTEQKSNAEITDPEEKPERSEPKSEKNPTEIQPKPKEKPKKINPESEKELSKITESSEITDKKSSFEITPDSSKTTLEIVPDVPEFTDEITPNTGFFTQEFSSNCSSFNFNHLIFIILSITILGIFIVYHNHSVL